MGVFVDVSVNVTPNGLVPVEVTGVNAATGVGVKLNHQYLAASKKEKVLKIEKLIAELNPAMKMDEVKLTASLMTKKDITELFDGLGFDKKQRKDYE